MCVCVFFFFLGGGVIRVMGLKVPDLRGFRGAFEFTDPAEPCLRVFLVCEELKGTVSETFRPPYLRFSG